MKAGDGNCFYRAIAKSIPRFKKSESNHLEVRRELADFISNTLEDSYNPLFDKYSEILDLFLLDSEENLIDRILTPDEMEGWGGYDIGPFVADAFRIRLVIYDALSMVDYEFSPTSWIDETSRELPTVHLWLNEGHYQILKGI